MSTKKKIKLVNWFLMGFFILSSTLVNAQGRKINGKIISAEDGKGLPGASVLIKGTTNGVSTDFDGSFTIKVNSQAVLSISFIGFVSKEVIVGNENNIRVVLSPELSKLEEVVVTGYGNVKKSQYAGSTTSIKASDLQKQPLTSIEQGFRGKLAGVQVTQSSGTPGAGISVRIRGASSFAGGNEPLYVIDGIPIFNDDVRGLNGLSSLNPNDIASIEVLKDASSTAIYGSRAANGVIQITTKSGSNSDKVSIQYNTFTSIQSVRKKYDLMSGDQYVDFAKEYLNVIADKSTPAGLTAFNTTNSRLDASRGINTDWQDLVYRDGIQQSHNLSFTGGNSNNNYFVSTEYNNQQGVVRNTDFERYSLRANIKNKLGERLSLDTRVSLSRSKQNAFLDSDGTNTRNFGKSGIGSVLLAIPNAPVYDAVTGKFTKIGGLYSINTDNDIENPAAILTARDQRIIDKVQAVFGLTTKVFKDLTNVTRVSIDYTDRKSDLYFPTTFTRLTNDAQVGTNKNINTLVEDYINYNKTFGKFGVDALLGASAQTNKSKSTFLSATGFPDDVLGGNALQLASVVNKPINLNIDQNLVSFFSRFQFDYDKKYLLSINARRDGSSVFSKNNKYGDFGAVGIAWRVSNESFLQNTKVSDLKLRVSYGTNGNTAIRPYQSINIGNVINTGQGGVNGGLSVGLAPTLENPNLTWETTAQSNFGIDFGLYNDRIKLTVDYYEKITNDLLARVPLGPSNGVTGIIDNVGKVQNKGIEFQLNLGIVESKNWDFALSGQLSLNENKVLETFGNLDIITANPASQSSNIVRVGEPLFSFYLPKYIRNSNSSDILTGEIYENVNNDVDAQGRPIINNLDNQVVGNPIPKITYGFNSDLRFKNLTFITNWQGVEGVQVFNVAGYQSNAPDAIFNRSTTVREYYPTLYKTFNRVRSDRFVEDASFLRLVNVKLSYDLKAKFLGSNKVNLFVSGQNLITITDYTGFDPEVNSFSGNDQRQGVDLGAYPSAKSYTMGLNITF